jgi:hypothetical protein
LPAWCGWLHWRCVADFSDRIVCQPISLLMCRRGARLLKPGRALGSPATGRNIPQTGQITAEPTEAIDMGLGVRSADCIGCKLRPAFDGNHDTDAESGMPRRVIGRIRAYGLGSVRRG